MVKCPKPKMPLKKKILTVKRTKSSRIARSRKFTNLINLSKNGELVIGLLLQFSTVLAERLELVDELVDHIPQPLVRQLHVDITVKDNLEEVAIVIPGVAALFKSRLKASVQVTEPHFLVKQAEDMIVFNVRSNHVDSGPIALLEKAVAEFLKTAFVHLVNLVHIFLANVAVQVHHEGFHDVGDVGGGVEAGLRRLQVAETVPKLRAIVIGVVVTASEVARAIVRHS